MLFRCGECTKSFGSSKNLNRHIKFVHNKIRPFPCEECDKSFCSTSHLNRHINYIHTKKKPFPCEECEKSFSCTSNLIKHIRFVHKKKKYGERLSVKGHKYIAHEYKKAYAKFGTNFNGENCLKVEEHIQRHVVDLGNQVNVEKRTQMYAQMHINGGHGGKNPFQCRDYGKISPRLYDSNRHLVIPLDSSQGPSQNGSQVSVDGIPSVEIFGYTCDTKVSCYCGMIFPDLLHLKKHTNQCVCASQIFCF